MDISVPGLNSIMCDCVHSTLVISYGYGDSGTKIHNIKQSPLKCISRPPCLASRTKLVRSSRWKGAILGAFGSNNNELDFKENEAGGGLRANNNSLKREKIENGVFGALNYDEPFKEKAKDRVFEGENLMGVRENEEFGALNYDEPFKEKAKDWVFKDENLMGVRENEQLGALNYDEPFKEKAKDWVFKDENLMGVRENEQLGALNFDQPFKGKEKDGVFEGENLMGIEEDGEDDELELRGIVDEVEKLMQGKAKRKGKLGSKSRKQLIKRSNLIAKQVIGIQSALNLGFVTQLWIDTASWVVLEVEVRPSLLSSESGNVPLEDVKQVGDVVLVQEENFVLNEFGMVGLETLVGYSVVTPGQRNLGKVRGYTFNINSGAVESLELDAFGYPIIPSSLVSTYALFTEDVLDVLSDTIIVHEETASRIQRLTKGFLGTQKTRTSKFNREYDGLEEESIRPVKGRKSRTKSSKRKQYPATRDLSDDLELPMDYM